VLEIKNATLVSLPVKVSSFSTTVSPETATEIVFKVSVAAKVNTLSVEGGR